MPKNYVVFDTSEDADVVTPEVRKAIREVWNDYELGNDWYYFEVPDDWWVPAEEWPEGMTETELFPEYETVIIDWLKSMGYTEDDNILLHYWW